jgi:perosamine synthetase
MGPRVADTTPRRMAPIRYPVSRPSLGSRERALLLDAFDSGWVSSRGAYVERVTREFPPLVGAAAGVPCTSGTAALHLALLALGTGPGDEVIVPDLTYVAPANAPLLVGATPVLADVRAHDWAIDPADVARLITPRTRGVIAVHLYGIVADLRELRALCDRHGLWLVEDCAEALGAPLAARSPGAWGELATWSFFGNNVLTSGEGGFVTTRTRADLIPAADAYRTLAVVPEQHYVHAHVGLNYRITNLQCALLCAQMESLAAFRDARAAIYDAYEEALAAAFGTRLLLPGPRPDVCWMYCALVNETRLTASRDRVAARLLEQHGIDSRPFPRPMHQLPHLAKGARGPLGVSARLSRAGLNLPTYVGLEPSDVRTIAAAFVDCVQEVVAA